MQKKLIGQELDRRYRIIRNLATGGFGQTYVAEDIRRPGNPRCVVKLLRPASIDSAFLDNARRLFVTEAETLERLGNHDRIPRLLAYFEEAEDFYLVQEFIDGSVLSAELMPSYRWATVKVVKLMRDVLEILCFIHSQNVIHRDIKPDNIIRRRGDDNLVLVDFGTVKQIRTQVAVAGHATATISVGTPGYMPTEQSHGKPRQSSDIYALGIIAIQALTGLHPSQLQENEESGELIWQRWAACDQPLIRIVEKMVCYHFRDRYRSASEVLQELDDYIQSHAGLARELAVLQPPEKTKFLPQPTAIVAGKKVASPKTTVIVKVLDTQTLETASTPVKSLLEPLSEPPLESPPEPQLELQLEPQPELQLEPQPEPLPELQPESSPELKIQPQTNPQVQPPIKLQPAATEIIPEKSALHPATTATLSSADLHSPELLSPIRQEKPSNLLQQRWLRVVAVGILSIVATAGAGRLFQSRKAWVQAERALIEAKDFQSKQIYESCIATASSVPEQYAQLYVSAQELAGSCWLSQAEALAGEQRLKDAIATARNIAPGLEAHSVAEDKIVEWAETIFQIAASDYSLGKYDSASAIIRAIPEDLALQTSVQQTLTGWKTEWEANNSAIAAAQALLGDKKWQAAIDEVKKVTLLNEPLAEDNPYWQESVQPLLAQANAGLAAEEKQRLAAAAAAAARSTAPTPSRPQPRQSAPAPRYSPPAYSPPPRRSAPAPARAPSGGGWNPEQR